MHQLIKFGLLILGGSAAYFLLGWMGVPSGILMGWVIFWLVMRPPRLDPEWFLFLWAPTNWNSFTTGWNVFHREPADRLGWRGWYIVFTNLLLSIGMVLIIVWRLKEDNMFRSEGMATPLEITCGFIFFFFVSAGLGLVSYLIDDLEGYLCEEQIRNVHQGDMPHPGHFLTKLVRWVAIFPLFGAFLFGMMVLLVVPVQLYKLFK